MRKLSEGFLLAHPPQPGIGARMSCSAGAATARWVAAPRSKPRWWLPTLRVCYPGGSVTEQSSGYPPRVTAFLPSVAALHGVDVEEVPAFCELRLEGAGIHGLRLVVARRPTSSSSSSSSTTATPSSRRTTPRPGLCARGIVRHIRDALPRCEVCFLYMFLRDDLPLHQRTGSKAWAENEDAAAARLSRARPSHARPRLRPPGCLIDLVPLMRRVPPSCEGGSSATTATLSSPARRSPPGHLRRALSCWSAHRLRHSWRSALVPGAASAAAREAVGRGRAERATAVLLYVKAPPPGEAAAAELRERLLRRRAARHGSTRQRAAQGVVAALRGRQRRGAPRGHGSGCSP